MAKKRTCNPRPLPTDDALLEQFALDFDTDNRTRHDIAAVRAALERRDRTTTWITLHRRQALANGRWKLGIDELYARFGDQFRSERFLNELLEGQNTLKRDTLFEALRAAIEEAAHARRGDLATTRRKRKRKPFSPADVREAVQLMLKREWNDKQDEQDEQDENGDEQDEQDEQDELDEQDEQDEQEGNGEEQENDASAELERARSPRQAMSDRSSSSPSSDQNVGSGAGGEDGDGGETGTEIMDEDMDMDMDMDINIPDDTHVAYPKTRDLKTRAVTEEECAALDFTTCTSRDGPLDSTSLLSLPLDAIRSTLTTREHSTTTQIGAFSTATDMKRQLSEPPENDRHTKRQMLNACLRPSASKGSLSSLVDPLVNTRHEDSFQQWLTGIAKGGSDGEGLRTSCRRVDDTSAYPNDSRTCILYTSEVGHIVACAYIEKRKSCYLYVAEETAIDVGDIKQHLSREMENDEHIEEVDFTPVITTFPYYAVVIAATCMCIHRPVPDDISAFPPIWSHAITTLDSGTADSDSDPGAALATVADVLPSTADVISTISQPNSSKKGGRVTKTAEEIRYHNTLSKLICEALDARAALAEALLADVALIAYLASFALNRSGGAENRSDGDVQEEIVSCQASLNAQRSLTQTRTTEAAITRLEAELRSLKGSQPETLNVRLRVVQKHMRHLAGFIAARRTEYRMEKSEFAWG